MPPILASLLTIGFIIWLFRRDFRERPDVTGALWIPLLWMLIVCSRYTSQWLNLFGLNLGAINLEDGSPVDALVFATLIAAGLLVLRNRHVKLADLVRHNRWLTMFLVYCFVSILWSDFPFVAFKRWIKTLGTPIMVLVLFTEPNVEEALSRLMKRCAYVLVPISILFIKYYPQLGRSFDQWSGGAVNTGITTNKNELGYVCLVLGLFFAWNLLKTLGWKRSRVRRDELFLTVGFLIMIGWLLRMAQSTTARVSLLLGILTMVLLGLRFVSKRFIGTYLIAAVFALLIAEATFGIYGSVLGVLGKDQTLTDRTLLWRDALQCDINPLIGAGFESFWLGERLEALSATRWWRPNQAHNGYIETYVNLGFVGCFFLLAVIISTFWKIRRELLTDFELGRFGLAVLIAILAYNWTEAGFKALHPVWFLFYIIAIDYRRSKVEFAEYSPRVRDEEAVEAVAFRRML